VFALVVVIAEIAVRLSCMTAIRAGTNAPSVASLPLLDNMMETNMAIRKLVLALLAVGASGWAVAENQNVEFYGMLNGDLEVVKASGAGAASLPNRVRVSSNISHLGARGSRDLGNGLKAIYQIESGLGLDTGTNTAGSTTLNFQGTLASRNSNVGLSGGFGTVFFGNWDTPYKVSTFGVDPFGAITIAAYTAVVGGGGTNSGNNNDIARALFDRRVQNSVQYWTPTMAGFSGRLAYGANEEKTTTRNPYVLSGSASYKDQGLMVTGAFERHVDAASSLDGKDTGVKIGGAYTFGSGTTLSAMAESIKYKGGFQSGALTVKGNVFNTAATSEVKLENYFIGVSHREGLHTFRASYGADRGLKVNGAKVSDSEARLVSVGYGYAFGKGTELFGFATKVTNQVNSANTFGPNLLAGVPKGADPQGIGFGMKYVF